MYYPQSQISTNLYTPGGELKDAFSGEDYKGYYFKTSDGRYKSGKTPQSPGSTDLSLQITGNNFVSPNLIKDATLLSLDQQVYSPSGANILNKPFYIGGPYFNISKIDYLSLNLTSPVNNVIYPTEKDYSNNKFQRYLLRKSNNAIFKEVNKQTYDLYVKKDQTVQYDLYYPIKFLWTIAGKSKNKVANINYNILKLTEERTKAFGLLKYFKNRLTEYYKVVGIQENLETDGTEYLISSTNLPYKGKYHIHPTKGAMVGATHVDVKHDFLKPIKQLNIEITGSNNNDLPPTISRGSFGGGGGGY